MSRDKRITIRLEGVEFDRVREQVLASGLSIAEYSRRRILGYSIVSKMDLLMLNELRRVGGLVKHVYKKTGGLYSLETAEALHALTACARKLERFILDDSKNTTIAAGQ